MVARRYEISLRVLKNIFHHERRNFVSPSGHVMFYLLYKHQRNTKPFHWERRDVSCSHSNRDLFTCEENMLLSHVKISCFRAKAHLVFHWYLSRDLLYLYNKMIYPLDRVICSLKNSAQNICYLK